jgi:hypothetical protein
MTRGGRCPKATMSLNRRPRGGLVLLRRENSLLPSQHAGDQATNSRRRHRHRHPRKIHPRLSRPLTTKGRASVSLATSFSDHQHITSITSAQWLEHTVARLSSPKADRTARRFSTRLVFAIGCCPHVTIGHGETWAGPAFIFVPYLARRRTGKRHTTPLDAPKAWANSWPT